ncbi:zinc-dependent alcohol dehydrogenase family protein [Labrys wisconsinensis]|uniref:enoyl-[acyl-carrier-protein] reductase n=1 Tax=Labrys wisconsinensis TaxID=425677 RepID=A0ABU0JD05_9HYPH|nr:zinc-dependent alcohol dehydrogenase family protein [Labrys wisconsinensis]MDQ0471017.1 NADPH:quinone reductase-like Zn-dependent oxidoreductase [Labrys wisconsinensis]
MQRVVARRFGPPQEVLQCEVASPPALAPQDVIVRMRASPINPSDLITVGGAYRHRVPLPFVPGFDGVGVVEEMGPAAAGVRLGQRVLPLGAAGGWQTLKALPAEWCVPVPDDLTDEQAATAYVNPLTARLMLQRLAPEPDQLVGVNAANSAIGRMLLRLLHRAGARAVAVVRSARARALLQDEPAAEIVLQGQALPPLAGGFDAVGGADGDAMARAVAAGGTLLHYGLLSGVPLPADQGRVQLFPLRAWVHAVSRPELHAAMAQVFQDIRTGMLGTAVEARYAFGDVQAALARHASPDRRGKVLFSAPE